MSIGFLDLWSIRCYIGAYLPSYWDHLEFVWFSVDCPRRDGGSCFDTLGFHHVFVRCHTRAYPPSYWDHLEFVWFSVGCPCRDDESCFDILGFHHVFLSDAILGHIPLVIRTIWSLFGSV